MKRIISLFIIILAFTGFYILGTWHKDTTNYNLVGFYNLTKNDPLFYSSFFDKEGFQKSINLLKENENKLKKTLTGTLKNSSDENKNEDIKIVEDNELYPYEFLKSLVLIDETTNEFYKNPSVLLGKKLLNLYDKSADSYAKSISEKISVLEKTEKYRDPNQYFFLIDSMTSLETIKNDFLTIKNNGYKLKEEIKKREDCLFNKSDCSEIINKNWNNIFIDLLKDKTPAPSGEKVDFIKNVIPNTSENKREILGPYKIDSPCWQTPNYKQWIYLSFTTKDNGEISIFPKLATQNYYEKISDNNTKEREKDFEYLYRADGTTYKCTDLTFYPELLVLNFFKERDIETTNIEKNSDYKLLMENQFGIMTPAINAIANHVLNMEDLMKIDNSWVTPEFLFSIRSAYSITYFPFAKSVWRVNEGLQYLLPKEKWPKMSHQQFYTIDDLEKMDYSLEKIKTFHPINQNQFIDLLMEF